MAGEREKSSKSGNRKAGAAGGGRGSDGVASAAEELAQQEITSRGQSWARSRQFATRPRGCCLVATDRREFIAALQKRNLPILRAGSAHLRELPLESFANRSSRSEISIAEHRLQASVALGCPTAGDFSVSNSFGLDSLDERLMSDPLPLEAIRIRSFAELAAWSGKWNELSGGNPFLRYEWLEAWWRNYGQHCGQPQQGRELFILLLCDDSKRLVGIAPLYVDRTATHGRVLRFLGGGEICSEYVSVRCAAGFEEAVTETLADYLALAGEADDDDRWDALKLAAIDESDSLIDRLLRHLEDRGHCVYRKPGVNRWRVSLPRTWEDYLATLSKCHRKKLRRLERDDMDSGGVAVHWVHSPADLDRALAILVDLHQRRWQTRGKTGCFASRRFLQFHRDATARLLSTNVLLMNWLELAGRPIAATYDLAGAGGVYAYQSGIDPASLDCQPGRLMNLASIRRAIERGDRFYDFLRGDEPYKANWRATPRPSYDAHVVSSRTSARLRFQVSSAAENVQRLLSSSRRLAENFING